MQPPSWLTAQLLVSALTIIALVHVILILVAYLVMAERKVSAYIQDRIGPNRVGFDFGLPFLAFLKGCLGMGQPLADGIKFMLKEDYTPDRVDKILFTLAPIIVVVPALMGFIIIPWGGVWIMPDLHVPFINMLIPGGPVHVAGAALNVGIVYLLAVASLGVYGIAIGGYASNSKFSFLGSLRATAQMISYEIPLGLSLMVALLVVGSVVPDAIIRHQVHHGWLVLSQPLAALLFFIAIMAEANRAPFDNAEAEQELVGGYHTEYSSMRFALYFLAEYAHMVTSSAFLVLLFFGGYQALPFVNDPLTSPDGVTIFAVLAKIGVFFGKVIAVTLFMMLIRWSIPRLRYDQIMMQAWQVAIPLALTLVVVVSVMTYLDLRGIVPMLLANLGVLALLLSVQKFLPQGDANKRLPMYGSRYSPMPGAIVRTQSDDPVALADSPAASV